MRALLLTRTPLEVALRQGLAPARGMFRWLVPGIGDMPALGLLGGDTTRLPSLADDQEMIGLEDHARPFFIDPMRLPRLEAEFPPLPALRARAVRDWHHGTLPVSSTVMAQYRAMRAALGAAEDAALAHWLAGLDAVLPPPLPGLAQQRDWAEYGHAWPAFLAMARQDPHWATMPEADAGSTSFILRSTIVSRLARPLADALARLPGAPAAMQQCFAARLVAMHLRHEAERTPLLRIAEVPLLVETRDAAAPPGFDTARYLELNPDVARAGMDAHSHWRACGWQEDRAWA